MAITKIQTRALVAAVTDDITANSAKTGITSEQASAITANTAKVTNSTSASDLTSGTLPDAAFPSTLPAASGANLTALPAANITGTLPAISATNLTNVPAANITGTLPAISGANLTGVRDTTGGRKNLIINGGFDVWQRGTSSTNNNTVLFAADRYATFSNGVSTTSQQAFTFGQTDVASNPKYYLRWDVSTYSSGDRIYQRIEDVITTSGQSVTLSYWAKAETATAMVPQATQAFGSGGSTAVTTAIDSVALTTSWQKFTRTFTLPSVSGKTIGAGSFLEVGLLRFTTSYTGYVDLANVQLELGSVATDFEHRSYGEELALCQRYFCTLSMAGVDAYYSAYLTRWMSEHISYPVTMRTTPTSSVKSGVVRLEYWQYGYMSDPISAINTQYMSNQGVTFIFIQVGSYSPTNAGMYTGVNTMIINLDAEL